MNGISAFDVSVSRIEKDGNRLEFSSDQRIQLEIAEKQETYGGFTGWPSEEWFFEHWWVKSFDSKVSTGWVVQNMPQVIWFHEDYTVPITPDHEIEFSFFVREERMSGPATEEWLNARWAIVRQIMETVTIDPPPFPVEPPASQ